MLAILVLFGSPLPDIAELDALARGRDASGMVAHAGPGLSNEDFAFLQRPGAFGSGTKGWRAHELHDPADGKTYVVFGTPITTQDYGEFVFEYAGGKLVRLQDERETRGYKVEHYGFEVRFQPATKRADLVATVRMRRSAGARPSVHLRLSPHYRVSKVSTPDGQPLKFAQASGVVSFAPPPGEATTAVLTYSGVVDMPGFAGAIINEEAMLTNDYWWPSIARMPATVTTTAVVPADWTLVTHGRKTADTVQGSVRTTTYQMDVPVSYLSLSAGQFRHEQRKVGRITYHVWSRDMTTEDMREQLGLMSDVVEFYERFAPYPFDDWGAVVTRLYGGGALEAYSYATYGTGWLPDEDTHEPSHTWFGGLLANTYLNSYWNESFAAFCGGYFGRELPVGNAEERRRAFVSTARMTSMYNNTPVAKGGAFAGGVASALGYGKGGLVLQQLERETGAEKMLLAVQTWLKDHPKGQPAEWEDFERAVNKATGQDYKWFFDQWIRNPGAPQFEITEVGYVQNEVRGRVDFRGVPYRLTTEVYAELTDGTRTHVDVVLNPERKTGITEFSFKLPKKPVFLSFDPYDRVLRQQSLGPDGSLTGVSRSLQTYVDPARKDYASTFASMVNARRNLDAVPTDLDRKFLIGHPDTLPAMRDLCRRAGFTVQGDKLTYDGTTIDLRSGAAMAVVDLGQGRYCAIGLGQTAKAPQIGSARLALVNNEGRFLRGHTEPRRDGAMVFRVP